MALEEERLEVHLCFRVGDSTLGAGIAWYYSFLLSAFELRGALVDLLISLRDVVFNLSQALQPADQGRRGEKRCPHCPFYCY